MKWLMMSTSALMLYSASVQASRLSEYIASPAVRTKLQEVYGGSVIQRADAFARLLSPRAGTSDQQKITLVNNF
ncbi:MAG: transglutaminase-like cysteine peptidase, partial [Aeromonas sp.]